MTWKENMIFANEDKILVWDKVIVTVLKTELISWQAMVTFSCGLLWKIDATGSTERKESSSRKCLAHMSENNGAVE